MPPAARHLGRIENLPFRIARQQRPRRVEPLFLADTGQHIGQRPPRCMMVERVAHRRQRQPLRRRHLAQKRQPRLVTAVTVQRRTGKDAAGGDVAYSPQLGGMAGIGVARRHHQQRGALRKAREIGKVKNRRRLAAAQIGLAQQHRQRFIAGTVGGMDDHLRPVDRCQPRPDHQPDAMVARRHMRPHDPGKRVHIGDADGIPSQRRRRLDHFVRMRGPAKEAEIAVAAQHHMARAVL